MKTNNPLKLSLKMPHHLYILTLIISCNFLLLVYSNYTTTLIYNFSVILNQTGINLTTF